MSAYGKSKIGENIMINKKVMLFFVGTIVANVLDVGAMNQQREIDMQQREIDMQQSMGIFSQNVTRFLEIAMRTYALPPTGVVERLDNAKLLYVAALGGGDLFGGLGEVASTPEELMLGLRRVFTRLAQEYERNHPESSRVANDTGSLRQGIDSLFEINPEGTSAENIVRGLTDGQLTKFVVDSGDGITAFVRTEHPELAQPFLFDGRQLRVSQIFLDGGAGRSYPPLRAYIAYIVGMYERDHPRTPEATGGI
jgi:hypothetical protein